MGLLDSLFGGLSTSGSGLGLMGALTNPSTMALLQAGGNILQSSQGQAGQGRPGFGSILGSGVQGLVNGAQVGQQMQQDAMRQKLIQQTFEDNQRRRQALYGTPWTNPDTGQTDQNAGGLIGQLPADQRYLAQAFPDQFGSAMAARAFPKPLDPTGDEREYALAKQQGFNGSFLDYKKTLAESMRAPSAPNETITKYNLLISAGKSPNEAAAIVAGGAGRGYYAIPTSTGYLKMDKTTGETSPITMADIKSGAVDLPGQGGAAPALPPSADVGLAGQKAKATALGTAQGTAASTLPSVEITAQNYLDQIDQLKKSPGKAYSLGVYSYAPTIPGTSQADFRARLDQIKGQAFLQAYNTLRGGGQITEVEGKKATDALGRLSTAQNEHDFNTALDDLKSIIQKGVEVQRRRAGAASSPDDALINKYLTPGQ